MPKSRRPPSPHDPVSLVGEEILEQHLELAARHRVDGRHAGPLVRLALPRPAAAQSGDRCDDEHDRSQYHHSGAHAVERGPDHEECRTTNGNRRAGC